MFAAVYWKKEEEESHHQSAATLLVYPEPVKAGRVPIAVVVAYPQLDVSDWWFWRVLKQKCLTHLAGRGIKGSRAQKARTVALVARIRQGPKFKVLWSAGFVQICQMKREIQGNVSGADGISEGKGNFATISGKSEKGVSTQIRL